MITERGLSTFESPLPRAWRRDTRWAASLSPGVIPRPWGRDVPRLERRNGTHRLVPQHLALRHGADAVPAGPQGNEHRHAGARERLGAVLRPGDFPGNRGFRRGAEPVTDEAAAFVAPYRAVRALHAGDRRRRRDRRGVSGRGGRVGNRLIGRENSAGG